MILPGTLDNPVYTEVYTERKTSRKIASSHVIVLLGKSPYTLYIVIFLPYHM
jgi:hypothetical protein